MAACILCGDMHYRGMKRIIAKTVAAVLVAVLCPVWGAQAVLAAPVITNMPHRADGTRITGNQTVPRSMPKDVTVKTKPQSTVTANPPAANKPAETKPIQQNAPVQAAPKPMQPAAQKTAPAQAPIQPAVKAETAKPAETKPVQQTAPIQAAPKPMQPAVQKTAPAQAPVQPAVKAETAKPAEAKPVQAAPKAEATNVVPKPVVKAAPAKLPTKPPGLETKKPAQGKQAATEKKARAQRPAKPEPEKSVYQVGDKGWKIKQAQQYLLKLGFDPDETDGRFTKSTRKAIRKFQKKYKLKETGNLDNATYEELKFQVEAKEYGGNVASTRILKTAAQYKGVPYVFGGTTPHGFDCSGYVQYVFAKNGIRLTRTADTQALEGKFVSKKNLKPGDLVFFTTYEPGASHVGIYAGNNLFWNATSSRGIMLSNLTDSYWGPRYYTARRILTGNDRSR